MADIGRTAPVTATGSGGLNSPSPSPARTGPLGLSGERWKEILIRDVGIAAVIGVLLFLVSYCSDERRATQAERLENLRFVRDVATRESGPMPFRNLDLEGMKLGGLRLPCRDDPTQRVGMCFIKADFTDANLSGADMRLMDLTGADFTRADLSDAHLEGSNLGGAIMNSAKLDGAHLDGVCSVGAVWPNGFDAPPDAEATGEVCNPGD